MQKSGIAFCVFTNYFDECNGWDRSDGQGYENKSSNKLYF